MFNFIKKLFCAHDYRFLRNIYGDQINAYGGMRSRWRCVKCGNVQSRDYLLEERGEEMKYDIWIEGFATNGNRSEAKLIASNVEAESFKDACAIAGYPDLNIWGCRLYDNERDARKTFG